MAVTIRPIKGDDKSGIMKILRATPEFTPDEVIVAEELIDLYLQHGTDSDYHILVANDNQTPAGYICYGPAPLTEGTWDIYWIAVDPDRQNQGTGRALLTNAEDEIIEAKGRLVLIETSSKTEYEKTRNFYRVMNYELIARIPDFYSPGDDKLVLQKRFK
ncbi:GNAT family N-acetyltransferase [Chloroflexota bacterium]